MNGDDICQAKSSKVLLVEGKKDCRVVRALQEHHGIVDSFGIFQCNGEDGVLKRLNALIPAPESERPIVIGVLLDADTAAIGDRWRQLESKLIKHGYALPQAPEPMGTIVEHAPQPKIGIWLMPDNQATGMLEDFLLRTIDVKHVEVATIAVRQAKEAGVATFREVHTSKATIHTYLAWQDEPATPLGLAITAHILSVECELCDNFVAWLRSLFG